MRTERRQKAITFCSGALQFRWEMDTENLPCLADPLLPGLCFRQGCSSLYLPQIRQQQLGYPPGGGRP
jgi:hypothetical protein